MPESSSFKPRLRGRGLRNTVQEKELPEVVAGIPGKDAHEITIRYKDAKDNLPAGMVRFEVSPQEIAILDFNRAPHRVRTGHGEACLTAALKHIKENYPGIPIKLTVLGDNVRAVQLYKKKGFTWMNPQEAEQKPDNYHNMVLNQ